MNITNEIKSERLRNLSNESLLKNAYLIDGEWKSSSSSSKTFPVHNPANGETICEIPRCGSAETQHSIEMADKAFRKYKNTTARQRSDLLMKWYHLVMENQTDLATILTEEQGKPFSEAMGEVTYAANFLRWYAEEAGRAYGDIIPSHKPQARIVVNRQPVGVVGIITPWNFPYAMITRKVAPALAAGCACVIKPSEFTPLSCIALGELAIQAGIPSGLINVVFGDAEAIGEELTKSKVVKKISFTGSTRVGKLLMEKSSGTVKRLSLELGGNAPFIVFDDADLERAVSELMLSKFRNTGQTCVCANRIFVQEGVQDKFVELLKQKVENLKVANGFTEGATQGPLINQAALDKVELHIQDAVSKGAQIVTGGERYNTISDQDGESGNGHYYCPTILVDVSRDAILNQEETFGPVAPIITFRDEAEVIEMANDTDFGLSAYFFTQNLSRAWKVAEAIEAGIVGVNEGIISTEIAPFGGVKQSGLGREGSKYGLDEYLEYQYILMGL